MGKIPQVLGKGLGQREFIRNEGTYNKGKVLIVDDEPINVEVLADTLPADEYETILAYSGPEALEKVAEETPDLIILDIMMPGMDGYEVIRRLKKDPSTYEIPIILITALHGMEDKLKGMEAGADEYLNKPVNIIELLTRVKSLVRLKRYREQLKIHVNSRDAFILPTGYKETIERTKDFPVVLLAEGKEEDARLIRGYLDGEHYHVKWARDGEETVSRTQKERIDVIILNTVLPDMEGFEVCRHLKGMDRTRNIQIIMVSPSPDLEGKIRGVDLGADDFFVKPVNVRELKARVNVLLRNKAHMDRLSANYENALQSAITDKLTGIYNQHYFRHFLEQEVRRSQRHSHVVALILMDVDDFKEYNDTLGHLAGDRILRELGQLLAQNIRTVDMVARYGGDEFALVLTYTDMERAVNTAERIRHMIHTHIFNDHISLPGKRMSASLGVAFCPRDSAEVDGLIEMADRSLYRAKREGKNRTCVHGQ